MITTAKQIEGITREHLHNGGLLFGQCVTAVGWVGGTIPPDCIDKGIIEIPMTDVAGPGFAVGAALMGKRPIFVVRYQGFMWLNASTLVNYAAKSKEVWGVPCPVFVRAIGMEGNGVGHTASGSLHALFMHTPGIRVEAPMTPKEYTEVWQRFMEGDDPVYCSEHRTSYGLIDESLPKRQITTKPKITIFAISAARLPVHQFAQKYAQDCDVFHITTLKPFFPSPTMLESLRCSGVGLVVDSGYTIAGASQAVAYALSRAAERPVHALGLADRVCGAGPRVENVTPSENSIANWVTTLIRKYK